MAQDERPWDTWLHGREKDYPAVILLLKVNIVLSAHFLWPPHFIPSPVYCKRNSWTRVFQSVGVWDKLWGVDSFDIADFVTARPVRSMGELSNYCVRENVV